MSKWLREGRFVYELNESGVNRWCASVQDAHTLEAELIEVARLIAAAPDLLEACEAAMAYDAAISRRAADGEYELHVDAAVAEGHDLDALYEAWSSKARAAIAKARSAA